MALGRVEYLRWAKALPERRYALASSSVPSPEADVFDPRSVEIDLGVTDAYGIDALIEAIAGRYMISPERVLPLPGTSTANFIVLGCLLRRGDRLIPFPTLVTDERGSPKLPVAGRRRGEPCGFADATRRFSAL